MSHRINGENETWQFSRLMPVARQLGELLDRWPVDRVAPTDREPTRLFEGAPPLEVIDDLAYWSMLKAQIDPALIYAWKNTGWMLCDTNAHFIPEIEIAEWEAAIDDYEQETGSRASHRRFTESDLQAISPTGRLSRRARVHSLGSH